VVPAGDNKACGILVGNLLNIDTFVRDFAAAVALYDLCDPGSPNLAIPSEHISALRMMSGSQGAIAIFNLAKTLAAIRGSLNKVPTLLPHIDTDALKTAEKKLKDAFPNVEAIRHGVAHGGEALATEHNVDKHMPSGTFETPIGPMRAENGGMIFLNRAFADRTFMTMWGKEVVSYSLDNASLAGVMSVVELVAFAFEKARRFSA